MIKTIPYILQTYFDHSIWQDNSVRPIMHMNETMNFLRWRISAPEPVIAD
jgi:hypothetical protein